MTKDEQKEQARLLSEGNAITRAKLSLTSLIKELVEEAKPEKLNDELNYSTYGEGHDTALDQFEQNLLKALEEV